jgi:hypothetical protein
MIAPRAPATLGDRNTRGLALDIADRPRVLRAADRGRGDSESPALGCFHALLTFALRKAGAYVVAYVEDTSDCGPRRDAARGQAAARSPRAVAERSLYR